MLRDRILACERWTAAIGTLMALSLLLLLPLPWQQGSREIQKWYSGTQVRKRKHTIASLSIANSISHLPFFWYKDYHDHSNCSDEWVEQRRQELQKAGVATDGGNKKKFPVLLHRMLEAVDGSNESLLVRWLPHGRAFVVLNKVRFEKEVLPVYFPGQTRYASFQRQLNIYGFLRLTRDCDGYYHELILRTRSTMAALVSRSNLSRNSIRRAYDSASEPDLYAMVWLPDVAHPTVTQPVE